MAGLINGTGWRKVDSDLKMLIKPIYFWLVASQYYKKLGLVSDAVGFQFSKRAGPL